jgi:hypothetical protein
MSARQAGLATSIIGLVGVPLQLLFYPRIQERLGTIMSYKIYSGLFPISYALIPFIPFTQSNSNGNGMLTWFCITFVLILHTTGRVVAIPATISLVNDSSPHPSLRGVVNGLGQSVTGTFRTYHWSIRFCIWFGKSVGRDTMVELSWGSVDWHTADLKRHCCVLRNKKHTG